VHVSGPKNCYFPKLKSYFVLFSPIFQSCSTPGFLRRSAAIFYDFLLLAAVLFVATAIVLPLNAGQAFTSRQIAYPLYLLAVSFSYYGWFWTHGGQTLGMKSWHIKVRTFNGEMLTWRQALFRFLGALLSWCCFGLGFAWIIADKNKLGWHDYWSKTALIFDNS
jgi:uncharacterized RDD family membrane protein YckC